MDFYPISCLIILEDAYRENVGGYASNMTGHVNNNLQQW